MGLFSSSKRGTNVQKGKQGFQKTAPKVAQPTQNTPIKLPAGATPPTVANNYPTISDMEARFRAAHPAYAAPAVAVPVPSGYSQEDDDYYEELEQVVYRCNTCNGEKPASEMANLSLCKACAGI